MGGPQIVNFSSPSPFPYTGTPHMETGTVFFAIHSVTQSRCINKNLAEETLTLYPNGATHSQQWRWQLGGSAAAAEAEAQRWLWR